MSDDTPTVEKPAEGAPPVKSSALQEAEIARLTDEIVTALKTVYDPEIPADIYEIGLIPLTGALMAALSPQEWSNYVRYAGCASKRPESALH